MNFTPLDCVIFGTLFVILSLVIPPGETCYRKVVPNHGHRHRPPPHHSGRHPHGGNHGKLYPQRQKGQGMYAGGYGYVPMNYKHSPPRPHGHHPVHPTLTEMEFYHEYHPHNGGGHGGYAGNYGYGKMPQKYHHPRPNHLHNDDHEYRHIVRHQEHGHKHVVHNHHQHHPHPHQRPNKHRQYAPMHGHRRHPQRHRLMGHSGKAYGHSEPYPNTEYSTNHIYSQPSVQHPIVAHSKEEKKKKEKWINEFEFAQLEKAVDQAIEKAYSREEGKIIVPEIFTLEFKRKKKKKIDPGIEDKQDENVL